jgi:site-specific DNA recombinase
VQRDTIERLAQRNGVTLGEIIEEIDVSGGKPIDERRLGEQVRAVEAGESEGIIVWKLARFSRSLLDGVTVASRVMKAGGRLIADDFDSNNPMAKAMLGFLLGVAEEQLDERREGWAQARAHAIRRGAYPTKTPWGYDRDESGRLVPNSKAPIIRELFARRARGATISELGEFLADVPPPNSDRATGSWSHSTIAQVLRNRAYTGEAKHGEYTNTDAHPAIVSRAQFDAAKVAKPVRTPKGSPRSSEALLAGLARCAGCGHTLKIVTGHGGRLRYYCKGPYANGACPARCLIRVDELDPYAEQWFLRAIRNEVRVAKAVKANGKLDAAQQAVDDADAELTAFVTMQSALDPSDFLAGYEAKKAKRELARLDLAELRSKASLLGDAPSGDLRANWPGLPIIDKRRLIAALTDTIRVSKGSGAVSERVQFVRDGVVVKGPAKVRVPVAK